MLPGAVLISEKSVWAGGGGPRVWYARVFRAAVPEQFRSHIEYAEQTPLIVFRLDGSATGVC
jgi:hypothetical protein